MAEPLTDQQRAQRDKARQRLTADIKRRGRLSFGTVRALPSGRVQARYVVDGARYTAPYTWDTVGDAVAWLNATQTDISRGQWVSPDERREQARQLESASKTLDALFDEYMEQSAVKARTRDLYEYQWARFVRGGQLGTLAVTSVSGDDMAKWRRTLPEAPRQRQQANDLVRAVLGLAIENKLIVSNPAATSRRKTKYKRAGGRVSSRTFRLTRAQVQAAASAMPPERQYAVLFTSGTGLRFGELAALRRSDLDIERDAAGDVTRVRVHVRRAVERAKDEHGVRRSTEGSPKSEAGVRSLILPRSLHAGLLSHLEDHAGAGAEGLLFPGADGRLLTPTTLYGAAPAKGRAGRGWYRARIEAGVPTARWHLLRHYAISEAVDAGATTAVLLARFGHTDMATSAIYQHAAENADTELADRL